MFPLSVEPELTCNLNAIAADQRESHQILMHSLLDAIIEVRELPEGYSFRWDITHLTAVQVWIANEQRCCPFFRFNLQIFKDDLWLELTGTGEVKKIIQTSLIKK